MKTLLQQLEAAIAETERIAREAAHCFGANWTLDIWDEEWLGVRAVRGDDDNAIIGEDNVGVAEGRHIVRNDPARVLRRVARDRKLLARHKPDSYVGIRCCSNCRQDHTILGDHDNNAQLVWWPCDDVRDLAEDYEIEVES